MKSPGRILVVDDDSDVLIAAKLFLKQHFELVKTEKYPDRVEKTLQQEEFDVVLLDMNFSSGKTAGNEGIRWLNTILKTDPSIPVIVMTAYGGIELAVKAIKEGAMDFVLKPWQNEKLLATIHAAMQLRHSKLEVRNLRSREEHLVKEIEKEFTDFIGESEGMKKVFSTIEKIAKTDANVLILGENGTGKELVARALHRHSLRKSQSFVSVDLGSISESLFESELFGHAKGSFTDAREDRVGRFEMSSGGTLFLDEIGNLSLPLQGKLLTAIQGRHVTRVGTNKPIPVDLRLISATNLPLYSMVKEHQFRQDLLYRINTVEIIIPPLRERGNDIIVLAEFFLNSFSKKYKKQGIRFSQKAVNELKTYHWPGNVRELQHCVERAVIMCDTMEVNTGDLVLPLQSNTESKVEHVGSNLETIEISTIKKVLSKHGGNISHTAKELGLTRAALYRRIEKYGI